MIWVELRNADNPNRRNSNPDVRHLTWIDGQNYFSKETNDIYRFRRVENLLQIFFSSFLEHKKVMFEYA